MNPRTKEPPGVTQFPAPGQSMVLYCGDTVTFTLTLSRPGSGRAWVRTDLGASSITRRETINRVEKNEIALGGAWQDIPMDRKGDTVFSVDLPLAETGHFHAKCFFIPEDSGTPVWPRGENSVLNVEPAGTCCANIIYNAFVRQFGSTKSGSGRPPGPDPAVDALDAKGYTVIPDSGKFRDLKQELGFIFSRLGCRALHLLPVHPTPTTYARMGRYGSPYAALSFTDVDPAMAEFDPAATPLEQFLELVDQVHYHNGYLILDIAVNHTGWAASIHETNPEWLVRGEDGRIKEPGAWGVVWADLTKLDYSQKSLWQYMAKVLLLWCHRGVDGFRCDAGYMIPVDAWEYMVAKVREEYPDTLFFLEGLGGPLESTRSILGRANFNWAYSELFQNYSAEEISSYLPFAWELSESCGHLIHFAETHDNNRLASISPEYARMRTALSALFSVCGGFGFANGVEWFATEKIDVHASPSLNWGAQENQVTHIARLNRLLKEHPAFFSGTRLELIQAETSRTLALLRHNPDADKRILVLMNLDCGADAEVAWDERRAGIPNRRLFDLLSGEAVSPSPDGGMFRLRLRPAQVLALTPDARDVEALHPDTEGSGMPDRVLMQKYKAKVLTIHTALNGYTGIQGMDVGNSARRLAADPAELVRSMNPDSDESRVIPFDVERDLNRQVMIPPGCFLLIRCPKGFRAELLERIGAETRSAGYEEGLPLADGSEWFALFPPKFPKKRHDAYTLMLRVFAPEGTRVHKASVLYLAPLDTLNMRSVFSRREISTHPRLKLLGTTRTGGMMRAAASWGELSSRYDGLLGANLNPAMPENRWMVFPRCRIWGIFQGYSRELALDCQEAFTFSYGNSGRWTFRVPTSDGRTYALALDLRLARDANQMALSLTRPPEGPGRLLPDHTPVTLVLRPEVEARSFHDTVKAFHGPETDWPRAVTAFDDGFTFPVAPGHTLRMTLEGARFHSSPQWTYMAHFPVEAERGLDDRSDLFSPGYFTLECLGGQQAVLEAAVVDARDTSRKGTQAPEQPDAAFESGISLYQAVIRGIDAFLVRREGARSVIAGYPWFLDWGRDSLIFCRSLVELGRTSDALAILDAFGRFEDHGTLPNMICGHSAENIETSDAPLWFFACCRDLVGKTRDAGVLDRDLGGRSLKQVLLSIAGAILEGTRTGVKCDPGSLLVYSPSHFTWMDTNYPAGSPRQGYPVEIQALWYNALRFLAEIDSSAEWLQMALTVRESVIGRFWNDNAGFFSDCLHLSGPAPAEAARPDDALRPNQLLLLTMDVIDRPPMARQAVETCLELLVPGAIRSLADRRLEVPLAIRHQGRVINDPHFPYSGTYQGDEDTQRKPAYHNGTAWTWPFPVFCEAWAGVFGPASHATCLNWLGSVIRIMRSGAAGHVPEILDGDYPHTPRGCDAQAWGISEVARVMHKLSSRSS